MDYIVDRPSTGPLWLSVVLSPPFPHPQQQPLPFKSVTMKIDAVTFE